MPPDRIQLSRAKGWRLPPGTVVVARPSIWGNPFRVGDFGIPDQAAAVQRYREWLAGRVAGPKHLDLLIRLPELRGKNLACWCKPGTPCHADVLMELANA
jgi:hypothetical protein